MKQFSSLSLSTFVLAVSLVITYVLPASANNQSSKLKRLRDKPKSVHQKSSVLDLEEVFDPYIGLVEDLNLDRRKQLVVVADTQMSMPMPSSQPTTLKPTLPPSLAPTTYSPTSIDFGKVEGRARNCAAAANIPFSASAVLLMTGLLS